jgi:signal transduction histidine kinase
MAPADPSLPSASEDAKALGRDARHAIHALDATKAIFATRDAEKLPGVIVEAAMQVMAADAVTLLLPTGDGSLSVAHASGLPDDVERSARVVIGAGIAGRVAESQVPAILNGVLTGGHGRARSSIVYPLVSGGRLLGLLTINRSSGGAPYAPDDLESAAMLASQILLAIENVRLVRHSAMSDKLAAVGQLAAGIAHEITAPVQLIGDSAHFLRGAVEDLQSLLGKYRALGQAIKDGGDATAVLDEVDALEDELRLDSLHEEMPRAIERSLEGVRRVAEIVLAVKSFARLEHKEKTRADINQLVQTSVVVARPEYRGVAELRLELGALAPILCYPSDLNQVLLSLIVNAAHAVKEVHKRTGAVGRIVIRTRMEPDALAVAISDTGAGIPVAVRDKIFDPFFTTKDAGKNTGLGLAIARTIVVDKHEGSLSFESEAGRGTTFWVRLPLVEESDS